MSREEVRHRLQAARLEDHVRETIQAAPPLTEQQLDRIAAHLRPRREVAS